MKEYLALTHLLLNETRALTKQIAEGGNKELAKTLTELTKNLTVEYDRQKQTYLIKILFQEKILFLEIEKKEFNFYQRADNSEAKEKNFLLGQDKIAEENKKQARLVLSKIFSQANIKVEDNILNNINNTNYANNLNTKDLSVYLVVLIALASAALTWYQGTQTFNLIDNTYTLEAAWRILNGEIPYKDFNLIVAPGIYLKQALLMKIFGEGAIVGLWWCMFAMASTVILTYLVLKTMDIPSYVACLLCLIPALGGNVVRPYVWYDVDALVFCLASIGLFLWSEKKSLLNKNLFFIGFLTATPFIFKQNIGLAHLVMISGVLYFQWLIFPYRFSIKNFFLYHLGVFTCLATLLLPFWYLGALSDFFYHTFFIASELRADKPITLIMRFFLPRFSYSNPDFPLNFPVPFFSTSFLLWGSLLINIFLWFVGTHRSLMQFLMSFWVFGLSLSAILALGAGSVFPLMPLMAIQIAIIFNFIKHFKNISSIFYYIIYLIVILYAFALAEHALAGYQLFFYRDSFTEPTPFKVEKLKGMSASPDVVRGIEEIVEYTNNKIPVTDTIALLITEDPIYFITSRKSPIKILQRYKKSGGDPNKIYLPELERTQPKWILSKNVVQFLHWETPTQSEKQWLYKNYRKVDKLSHYEVWKKIENANQ